MITRKLAWAVLAVACWGLILAGLDAPLARPGSCLVPPTCSGHPTPADSWAHDQATAVLTAGAGARRPGSDTTPLGPIRLCRAAGADPAHAAAPSGQGPDREARALEGVSIPLLR